MSYRGVVGLISALALSGAARADALAGGPGGSGGTGPTSTTTTTSSITTTTTTTGGGPGSGPLATRGMWIWELSRSSGGDVTAIDTIARRYGVKTLLIKSGDGTTIWPQFNSSLVSELHGVGLHVCAWQYVYGTHPIYEAEVGSAAVHDGADCLVIDAEAEYQGRYVQAQQYLRKLRQMIGSKFPVALAGFPYVDYHPSFPYSVFLGPAGAQFNVPQMYWKDIGVSVDTVYTHTYSFNAPYGRPIDPLGEVAGSPPPRQVIRFRQLSRAYGAGGVSWWDWQESTGREWQAVGRPVSNLTAYTPHYAFPALSVRGAGGISAGDLVVWAQEHLYSAGFHVRIDGDFRARTQAAVEQFQSAHGLNVTGLIDTATWQALLRYPAARVIWSTHRGKTTASVSRTSLVLPPPGSARLRALAYEIPAHLGSGSPPRG